MAPIYTRAGAFSRPFFQDEAAVPEVQVDPVGPEDRIAEKAGGVESRYLAEGGLAGTVTVTFLGQEALVRRVDHIGDDETEVRQDFENELAELLPAGAKVTVTELENIDNNADSVVAHFKIVLDGLATPAGNKTILPVSPLLGSRRHPFRHAKRTHPVYFPYPHREFDDIVVTLPAGMTAETVPPARKKDLEAFGFSLVCVGEDGGKLHVQRDLVVKKSFFAVDQFKAVKAFFDEVTAGDEELVVLRRPDAPGR